MNKLNNFLQYVYHVVAAIWFVGGAILFFNILPEYHQNLITAVYGFLIGLVMIYVGFLHKKALLINSTILPIISSLNLILAAFIIYLYSFTSDHGDLLTYVLVFVLAIVTFMTLCIGSFEVRKVWKASTLITILLIVTTCIWTYIFTNN